MRRRLLILVVFLLAGAVVNVAVAWRCAIRIPSSGPYIGEQRRTAHRCELDGNGRRWYWGIIRFDRWGVESYYSRWDSRTGLVHCDQDSSTELDPSEWAPAGTGLHIRPATDHEIRCIRAFGWPVVSMWCEYGPAAYGVRHEFLLTSLPPDGDFPQALPLRPIWPGFAVNTLFYAAVLWLLIPGPYALRRFIRVKRGLCVACAYPVGESEVCSECGKAIPCASQRIMGNG